MDQPEEQVQFVDALNRNWSNISTNQYRVYEFPGGHKVRLEKPLKLFVSESGGHRVFTADGISHYIPTGWIHLYWEVGENQPNFVL
jgi:hypothetical protein